MGTRHLRLVVLFAMVAPAQVFAQEAGRPPAERRVAAGLLWQAGTFGDDSARRTDPGLGLVAGLGFRRHPEELTGLSFDVALEPTAIRNPHFDERVRRLHVAVGLEIGRRVYVRPMIGAGINLWSGDTDQALGLGPSFGVAVGASHRTGAGWSIGPEWVTRANVERGAYTWSSGVQLIIGTGP